MTAAAARPRWFQSQRRHVKFDTAYGRIVVQGNDMLLAQGVPGAHHNFNRGWVEVSLTLDTLRMLRRLYDFKQPEMAERMSSALLSWARAAGRYEKQLMDIHQRLDSGWRVPLPWADTTGNADGNYRPQFSHQDVMATVACSLDGAAFLCEMGTGKTRAAIEAMRYHMEHETFNVAIVVCPKSVMGTWQREIPMWSEGLHVVRLDGPIRKRIETVRAALRLRSKKIVFITNYDALHRMRDFWIDMCRLHRVGMICDEMHRIKNPLALQSAAAMELARRAVWRLGQTGTPVLNGIQDIWSQWYFVDLGIEFGSNFVQFRREWIDENPYTHTITPKAGALDGVGAKLRRRGLRFTKAECLDLPPKVYEVEEVEMTPQQRTAYRQMEEYLIAEIESMEAEGTATAANQMVAILRLTQITSGHAPVEETGQLVRFTPNPKLDRLEELVRENIDSNSIIVWARYREDVRAISERLTDLRPVIIQGMQKPSERDLAEAMFKDGRARLLVANPASGGEGLDLWKASLVFYYSQGYSLLHRAQSEDRSHRKGSEIHDSVTYVDLPCVGTVDQIIRNALDGKKSVASLVVDLREHIGIGRAA